MSEGKRPGGLTALAVINFVFGGFDALGAAGSLGVVTMRDKLAANATEQGNADAARAMQQLDPVTLYVNFAFAAVCGFLVIAAGVGYLKQKKVLGRGFGNAYSLVSIASSVTMMMISSRQDGGLITIIFIIYPVLTLILINGTFKHDFVR